jgi:predicted N-acyltransferase
MKSATAEKASNDYVIRVFDDPAAIAATAWASLLGAAASSTPFMRHAYLLAMHRSASAVAETGWLPQFLAVFDGDTLIAACPLYLKEHSYGEYVMLCSIGVCVHTRRCRVWQRQMTQLS